MQIDEQAAAVIPRVRVRTAARYNEDEADEELMRVRSNSHFRCPPML